jgi:hypothetical protein
MAGEVIDFHGATVRSKIKKLRVFNKPTKISKPLNSLWYLDFATKQFIN